MSRIRLALFLSLISGVLLLGAMAWLGFATVFAPVPVAANLWQNAIMKTFFAFFAAAIIFFCFFYTALVFNSKDTADNLKRSGAFIPGIRPGEQTARYIDQVMSRLTFAGALYITAVCLMPEFLIVGWNVPFYFGGTSLLIVVVVVMDFMAQVQAHVMSHQYEGLMKKANLKGIGGTGMPR